MAELKQASFCSFGLTKTFRKKALVSMLGLSLLSCSIHAEEPANSPSEREGYTQLVSKTQTIPDGYLNEVVQQGEVVRIDYDTRDYADGTMAVWQNTAYVYLPYGYDTDTERRYNVLYLVHGHYGTASTYLTVEDGMLRRVLDQMIAHGDIDPLIVVTPSYNYGSPTPDYVDADKYCKALPLELQHDLIPLVESRYRTYAETTSETGLKASRSHRAIGGFSMGGVTTWYALDQTLGLFRWFLPISGDCWSLGAFAGMNRPEDTARYLAERITAQDYTAGDFYIWAASGTNDSAYRETLNQIEGMAGLSEMFTLQNMTFHEKDGARHEYRPTIEYIYNALQFFFPPTNTETMTNYYTRQTHINDVMNDAAFGDYGRLIFPVNTGYWSGTTLEQLDLTWYNYIDPDKTVEVCNYLRAHADNCFIDIYTEAEKQANPELRNTGLFFFRGNSNAPFAICNAGGGFSYVGAMHDSFPHALELSKLGYNAFALIYRPGDAYEDLARAITYICDHANELGVNPTSYSLWGGSAGARMAATLGNSANLRSLTGRTDLPKASAVIMQYTGYTTVSQYDGATYACCGTNDGIASWRTMQSRLESLSALGIPTEFHSYSGLPHGFGLGTGTVAEGWLDDAVRFWQQQSGATAIRSAKSNTKQQNSIYSLNGTRRNAIQKGINIVGGKTILK